MSTLFGLPVTVWSPVPSPQLIVQLVIGWFDGFARRRQVERVGRVLIDRGWSADRDRGRDDLGRHVDGAAAANVPSSSVAEAVIVYEPASA